MEGESVRKTGFASTTVKRDLQRKASLFKIKLAPLKVPPQRRLQTLAALGWVLIPFLTGPFSWMVLLYMMVYTTLFRYLAIAYLLWMYIDKDACETGGRRWERLRSLQWWNYYRDYFPVHLVKTVDLPPNRNYLFAVYPHGILASGVFAAFLTHALKFENIFKGLKAYVCTLKSNFQYPVLRDYCLCMGMNAASQKSLNWILSSPGKGRAAVLVVGGAAEAFFNKPGVYKIVLKHRKGFCRVALQNGSPLVPVFSFGEIDLYEQLIPEENSQLSRIQHWFKKATGMAPIIFYGRGVFNYTFGWVPRRAPVTVVVGKPIEVERVENPTKEQIDELHMRFTEGIVKLFNEEKHKYLEDPDTDLIID